MSSIGREAIVRLVRCPHYPNSSFSIAAAMLVTRSPALGLPAAVVYSAAYTRLCLAAQAVLTEILGLFKGYNNDVIDISSHGLCARLNTTNARRILDATRELFDSGMISTLLSRDVKSTASSPVSAQLHHQRQVTTVSARDERICGNTPKSIFSRADHASARKPALLNVRQ